MSLRKKLIMATSIGKQQFSDIPFPEYIGIELNSKCNLSCPFCPNNNPDRRPEIWMNKEMFNKIIDEVKKENPHIKEIALHQFGEPLLNSEIFDFIRIVRKKMPNTKIDFSSNGSLLTKEIGKKIIDSGMTFISLFEKQQNKQTWQKIADFLDQTKGKNIQVDIGVLFFSNNDQKEYIDFIRPHMHDNSRFAYFETHDWAGQTNYPHLINRAGGILKTPCKMPFRHCFVFADGSIIPCCFDYYQKNCVGNVNDMSIKEAWTSPKWKALRERLLTGTIGKNELCWNCHYYRQKMIKVLKMILTNKSAYSKKSDIKKYQTNEVFIR